MNALPNNTLVHLPWGEFVLPDGYIPATAQETLLHVYLGESAAAHLVQQVANAQAPPEPAPQQPPSPARVPGACQGSASESSCSSSDSTPSSASAAPNNLGATARCRPAAIRILTPLRPVLRTLCRDHACKQPWLVSTNSLPRMFCCNLVPCSAARQPFAKHSSAGPSLSLSNWSAMLRAPIPPARRWHPQPSPELGKRGCSCIACSCSDLVTCAITEGAETATPRQVHDIFPGRLEQLVACRPRRGWRGRPAQRLAQ